MDFMAVVCMPPNPMHFLVGHAAVQIKVAVRQAHNRRQAATVYLSILRRTAVRVSGSATPSAPSSGDTSKNAEIPASNR